jgi:hypothetical protein
VVANRVGAWLREMEAAGFGLLSGEPHAAPQRLAKPAAGQARTLAASATAQGAPIARHDDIVSSGEPFPVRVPETHAPPPAHALAIHAPHRSERAADRACVAHEASASALSHARSPAANSRGSNAQGASSHVAASWGGPSSRHVHAMQGQATRAGSASQSDRPDEQPARFAPAGEAAVPADAQTHDAARRPDAPIPAAAVAAAGTSGEAPAVIAAAAEGTTAPGMPTATARAIAQPTMQPIARDPASPAPPSGASIAGEETQEAAPPAPSREVFDRDRDIAARQMHVQRRADGVDVWIRDAGLQPQQIQRVVGAWLAHAWGNGLRPRTVTVNGSVAFKAASARDRDNAALFETGPAPSRPARGEPHQEK